MAISKSSQNIANIDQVVTKALDSGILHLSTEDRDLDGRQITIKGKKLINFSSCSYLGLELHPNLIASVQEAASRYGTQFSSSRTYISIGLYEELEGLLEKIFNRPVLVTASTTLGHLSNIPVLIGPEDALILDHQVHASVNMATQLVKARGNKIEMIRHNRMDMLESRIKKLINGHDKIWYMADGLYSMFGDFAPFDDLKLLLDKYEQLHLYIDDAHSISWLGKNGSGSVLDKLAHHPRVYVTGSLNKSFGAAGGVMIYPNEEAKQRVRNCGGTMIFSGPVQPPMLAAGIASAQLHLSSNHKYRQEALHKKIKYFNRIAKDLELPLVCNSLSPIRYFRLGEPDLAYNLTTRLKDLGYFVNLSTYPSVPFKDSGIRMTLHNHLTFSDISNILHLISEHLPMAIQEQKSLNQGTSPALELLKA